MHLMFRRIIVVVLPRLVVVSQLVHATISIFTFLPFPPPETAARSARQPETMSSYSIKTLT